MVEVLARSLVQPPRFPLGAGGSGLYRRPRQLRHVRPDELGDPRALGSADESAGGDQHFDIAVAPEHDEVRISVGSANAVPASAVVEWRPWVRRPVVSAAAVEACPIIAEGPTIAERPIIPEGPTIAVRPIIAEGPTIAERPPVASGSPHAIGPPGSRLRDRRFQSSSRPHDRRGACRRLIWASCGAP
jgi:hypothetical protein